MNNRKLTHLERGGSSRCTVDSTSSLALLQRHFIANAVSIGILDQAYSPPVAAMFVCTAASGAVVDLSNLIFKVQKAAPVIHHRDCLTTGMF